MQMMDSRSLIALVRSRSSIFHVIRSKMNYRSARCSRHIYIVYTICDIYIYIRNPNKRGSGLKLVENARLCKRWIHVDSERSLTALVRLRNQKTSERVEVRQLGVRRRAIDFLRLPRRR